ncbi:hypothetical protein MTO96_027051 [Rhipicephalus appendiculatus]
MRVVMGIVGASAIAACSSMIGVVSQIDAAVHSLPRRSATIAMKFGVPVYSAASTHKVRTVKSGTEERPTSSPAAGIVELANLSMNLCEHNFFPQFGGKSDHFVCYQSGLTARNYRIRLPDLAEDSLAVAEHAILLSAVII